MEQAKDPVSDATKAICDALRYLGDASYAVLPQDIAHNLANLKKSFLNNLKSLIDKDMNWIDERVAGGDRLREEWRQEWKNACSQEPTPETGEPLN